MRARRYAAALLWFVCAAGVLHGGAAASDACNVQLDATGAYDKSNNEFAFDVVSSTDVIVTSISVRFLEAQRSQAALTVSFKEEGWASNALSWAPVAAARNGWHETVPTFTLTQRLRAGVHSSFMLQCSSNSIRYNFQPYYAGVQTAAVTDGLLAVLPGAGALNRTRYFAGYVGYALATPACAAMPPAPGPPPAPPPPAFVLPTLPAGGAYVYSEADLLAAIANAAVTDIVLAASIRLSSGAVVVPASSTLLSISGNAESCALAAGGSPVVDYDYVAYVAPVSSPLSSAACTIDGGTVSRILVVELPSLALSNLQFVNGWALSSASADRNGGAVYMPDAEDPSTCSSLLEVDGCVFAGCGAYASGGALFACDVRISNSLFRNNGASNGGDMYVAGDLNVETSVFMQSFAYSSGGSLYVDNAARHTPPIPSYISDSVFTFEGGFVLSVTPTTGGAIFMAKDVPWLVMTNVSIDSFYANQGGGIFLDEGDTIIMRGCSVSQCTSSSDGGGIHMAASTWLFLLDTTIANNTAGNGGGGGVSIQQWSTAVAMSTSAGGPAACAIAGNNAGATGQGGGVYVSVGAAFLASGACSVSGNTAQSGGGVFIAGGNAADNLAYAAGGLDLLPTSLFTDAADDAGWAIGNLPNELRWAIGAQVPWTFFIDSATMSGNSATQVGGAVYCGAAALCGFQHATLAGNTAGTSGAGLYAVGSAQVAASNLSCAGNAAGAYGGALSLSGVPQAVIASSSLAANSAGIGGGALYAIDSTAAVNDTSFSSNVAGGVLPRGGAVYLRDAAAFVFGGCLFANNSAGALAAESGASPGTAQLVEPYGAFEGGALSMLAASAPVNVSVFGSRFLGNSAAEGGALAAHGSAVVSALLAGTAFEGNSASRGGVLTLGQAADVSIDNCSFTSNTAELGAVFLTLSAADVPATANSVLDNNTALNYGPLAATLPVNWTLQHPGEARTGGSLPIEVRMYDLFAQQVSYWQDAVVQARAGNVSFLSGVTAESYAAGAASFSDLLIHGEPSRSYLLTVSVESPTLMLQVPAAQSLSVTVTQCNFAEVFNPTTLACECVLQATYDADLGACVCGFAFYMSLEQAECLPCPSGGFCPGNNYAYPLANYWHVPYNWTRFYECEQEYCEALEPAGDPSRPNCREAHTGLLCASCVEGAAFQGQFCAVCEPGTAWSQWSPGKRAGFMIGFVSCLLALLLYILLPLNMRLHDKLLGYVSAAYAVLIGSVFDKLSAYLYDRQPEDRVAAAPRETSLLSADAKRDAQIDGFSQALSKMGEPVRLVIDQIQIMSSFTRTMRIDWPPIFFKIISVLSVLNFDFLQLPSTACMTPRISYFTYFLGITLGFSCAAGTLLLLWAVALTVARLRGVSSEARDRFSASCLSKFILALSVAYTPVAEAIMGVFGCERIEGTYWLLADLREQCYTRRHYTFYPVAIFFLIFFVFGIPVFFLAVFYHFRIPQMVAERKRDARLRALVQYGFAHQLPQPACNVQTLTALSISDEHVDALYTELFRTAADFRRHATKRLTRAFEMGQQDEKHVVDVDGASPHGAGDAASVTSGDANRSPAADLDADFAMRGVAPAKPARLSSASLKRTMKTLVASAVSTLSGSEAPHVAASQVHELLRPFKMGELLRWSAIHLHAPPMRWAEHEVVDCIEHLYGHLHCENWCAARLRLPGAPAPADLTYPWQVLGAHRAAAQVLVRVRHRLHQPRQLVADRGSHHAVFCLSAGVHLLATLRRHTHAPGRVLRLLLAARLLLHRAAAQGEDRCVERQGRARLLRPRGRAHHGRVCHARPCVPGVAAPRALQGPTRPSDNTSPSFRLRSPRD